MLRNPASIPERRGRCACGHNHDVAPEICGSRPPRFSLLPKEILAMRHILDPPISTAPTLLPLLHPFCEHSEQERESPFRTVIHSISL